MLPELQNWRKNAVKRVFGDLLSGRYFTSGAAYGYIECKGARF
uniref:Orf140 n=1 Tax=Serratia marcescens TaxID=615 RepID=A0A7S7BUD6_SERMA|nr:Orf140 [Serratia marcescens]